MKIKINKSKTKMLAIRLSEADYNEIQKMATKEKVPQTEICRALISAALEEIKIN